MNKPLHNNCTHLTEIMKTAIQNTKPSEFTAGLWQSDLVTLNKVLELGLYYARISNGLKVKEYSLDWNFDGIRMWNFDTARLIEKQARS
jgi:hypothetical protein